MNHRELALHQKEQAEQIAGKIERNETLTALERKAAAAFVRRAGRAIYPVDATHKGKLPPSIAFEAAMLIVHRREAPTAAAEILAARYGAAVSTTQQALGLLPSKPLAEEKRAALDAAIETLQRI